MTSINFEERFWSNVKRTESCWLWTACQDGHGYGLTSRNGRRLKAHRAAYELEIGPIPVGKLIDHKCHNRACVNPQHLQAVTVKENLENRVGAPGNSTSGVRGVSWAKREGRWAVKVVHWGKGHYGGMYDSLDEAEAAAVALRNSLFTNNLVDRAAREGVAR